MNETIKTIEIDDFIKIRILEFNGESYVDFVEDYNKKYFYINKDNELCTYQQTSISRKLYYQKANFIHRFALNVLEKEVYKLHRQLTFKIPRATEEQDYYFISTTFEVRRMTDFNGKISNPHYKAYNYFLSEEEATKYAKILQETLVKLRKEEYIKGE